MEQNLSIRKMALAAKNRLNSASKEKEKRQKKQINAFTVYKNLYKSDFQIVTVKSTDDELYLKVKQILDTDYDCPHILKALVNEDEYEKLSDDKKMEYMLKLADRYNKLKTRYIKENNLNLAI